MHLEIRGHNLPGRYWHLDGQPCDNVHVGIQVGREPRELVSGAADEAVWSTEITVGERNGELDYRGPAVQGRRGGRFLYLTWGHVATDGTFRMFRRAKLMMPDLAPLIEADPGRRLIATVDLTDDCGGPRCARLRPPALEVTAQ